MDGQTRLLSLLETVLGASKKSGKSNFVFHCPKCNHRKPKLEINVENQYYHCWVCDADLRGKSIKTMFTKLNVDAKYIKELNEINHVYGGPVTPKTTGKIIPIDAPMMVMPPEAIPLWIPTDDQEQRKALQYLYGPKRGLTDVEIAKYKIHYCTSGKYRGMLIIPSYDERNALNYFFARSYVNDFKLNPAGTRDVIMFESNINWSFPIILVEGMFDAIACRRNAIPLGGKTILPKLNTQLHAKRVKDIYIALDADAVTHQLFLVKQLMRDGYSVHWIDTTGGDPASLGYDEMRKRIDAAGPLSFKDLMQLKLEE